MVFWQNTRVIITVYFLMKYMLIMSDVFLTKYRVIITVYFLMKYMLIMSDGFLTKYRFIITVYFLTKHMFIMSDDFLLKYRFILKDNFLMKSRLNDFPIKIKFHIHKYFTIQWYFLSTDDFPINWGSYDFFNFEFFVLYIVPIGFSDHFPFPKDQSFQSNQRSFWNSVIRSFPYSSNPGYSCFLFCLFYFIFYEFQFNIFFCEYC